MCEFARRSGSYQGDEQHLVSLKQNRSRLELLGTFAWDFYFSEILDPRFMPVFYSLKHLFKAGKYTYCVSPITFGKNNLERVV